MHLLAPHTRSQSHSATCAPYVGAVQNRPDSKFRLAVASFKESPDNCIEIITCTPALAPLLQPQKSPRTLLSLSLACCSGR